MDRLIIAKAWDGNVLESERGNRIYASRGRWQYVVEFNGVTHDAHDTQHEARRQAARIAYAAGYKIAGWKKPIGGTSEAKLEVR